MNFQILPIQLNEIAHLFDLNDAELTAQKASRHIVSSKPGTPCRVSMQDADIGETVILFNYVHQPEEGPYQASHAVFVRENAKQAVPAINEVPDVIQSRLISLRYFGHDYMMMDADVVQRTDFATHLNKAFDNDSIAYVHIHNAKPGCFAGSAHRA